MGKEISRVLSRCASVSVQMFQKTENIHHRPHLSLVVVAHAVVVLFLETIKTEI